MTYEPQYTEAQLAAQKESERRRAEETEALRGFYERMGLPLICHDRACRRARRCRGDVKDGKLGALPCFWHYREEMRFLLFSPGALMQLWEEVVPQAPGSADPDAPEPTVGYIPSDPNKPTLLELIFGSDAKALAKLRRPKHGKRPGSWERDPEAFERYFMSGDWRDPGDVCRREPVLMGGRWVE
jgi:hypothetical protein